MLRVFFRERGLRRGARFGRSQEFGHAAIYELVSPDNLQERRSGNQRGRDCRNRGNQYDAKVIVHPYATLVACNRPALNVSV